MFWRMYQNMQYRKFKPDPKLTDFIECYFAWSGTADAAINLESPPSSLCSFVFNFGDTYAISSHKYERNAVPRFFISGQALKNYTLHLKGNIRMVGAVLRPTTLFNFFDLPMYSFTEERVSFHEIKKEAAAALQYQIENASETRAKIAILERYFLQFLESKHFGTLEIRKAANAIFDTKGRLNILELLEDIPMSRRSFERKFLNEVGVSPKTYSRIRRFGHTCALMAGKRDVKLMDVLHEGGYYDQSHFIKDFKYFSGRTPKTYVKTNLELANYVDQVQIVAHRLHDGN